MRLWSKLHAGLLLLVLFGTNADAQPYEGCGTLINQPFGGCVLLFESLDTMEILQMSGVSTAGYEVGDVVYVEGDIFTPCATFCSINGCIELTLIVPCTVPFSECGTLVQGPSCVLFEGSGGELYELEDLGSFEVGDTVAVEGALDIYSPPTCPGADGSIAGNTIVSCAGALPFVRGDADGDGIVNGLIDGLLILNFQFIPGSVPPPCMDAADVDDSGIFNGLLDGLFLLNYQFVPGSPFPPDPGPASCGPDPTVDGLDCEVASPCP